MTFFRTLVLLVNMIVLVLVVGYFWMAGYTAVHLLVERGAGVEPGDWLFALYWVASLAAAFFLTRRRRLA